MQTKRMIPCLTLAAILAVTVGTAGAASIGMNFLGDGGDTPTSFALAPDNEAGVVAQTNWNNILSYLNTPNWGLVQALGDDTGQITTVSLYYQANDAWHSDGPEAPSDGSTNYNYMMMYGILKASAPGYDPPADDIPAGTMDLTIGGLPAGNYDVYVYCADNGNPQVALNIGTQTNYLQEISSFDGTFVQATSIDPSNPDTSANYCLWSNVPADAQGKILIVGTMLDRIADGMGVCGIQIVKKSPGPFPPNSLAPEFTQQPTSTYAAVGGTATFSIALNGPWAVQWQKNGTPIAGATGLTYTTPPLALSDSGSSYVATVTNNVSTTNSVAATVTVDPASAPVLTQGFLTVQRYTNIAGANLSLFYADPSYPSSPATNYWVAGASVPQTVPNLDNFGAIAWGWLAPAITADYTFFIRSDDASGFYINTNAAAAGVTNAVPIPYSGVPGSDLPVCEESGCCQDFLEPDPGQSNWHPGEFVPDSGQTTLTPIHLEAGKLYGICLAYKEATGDDYVQLAWRAAGDTTPAADLQPIGMPYVWTMASHAGNRVSIQQQPQSTTVLTNTTATFKVDAATLPTADQWDAQWLKNGVEIPGATGASYTTPPLALVDTGTTYSARIIALAGATNSAPATVTVVTSLATTLTIMLNGNNVTIGWTGSGGTLQSTPALLGVNTVWTTVGTQNPTTLPIVTNENRYYRVMQ